MYLSGEEPRLDAAAHAEALLKKKNNSRSVYIHTRAHTLGLALTLPRNP